MSCPICDDPDATEQLIANGKLISCRRCGPWIIDSISASIPDGLQSKLGAWDLNSIHRRSRLSHLIRQRSNGGNWVQVSFFSLEDWKLEDPLPTPAEQLDSLVLLIGDQQPSPGNGANLDPQAIAATVGMTITRSQNTDFEWLLTQPETKEWVVDRNYRLHEIYLFLTLGGWARYRELKHQHVESRRVLMAMKFGDTELNNIVEMAFRPAVTRAGFELRLLNEKQPAGLIDDQLRVALRTSRFVIADLTHSNNGAYWEAGFAEGLGRPVIYTCRDDVWRERKTHFDTNHLVTVSWLPDQVARVSERLTATIRATLPAEAKMVD